MRRQTVIVGAEHDHVVARLAEEVVDHPQRDHVQRAGRGGEHDPVGPAGNRQAREVLVRDGDLAALPEVADEPQRGGDDVVVDLRGAELRLHRLADGDLGFAHRCPGTDHIRPGASRRDCPP
jgi:hypothetical protein